MLILTVLSVLTLIGLADGVQREFERHTVSTGARADQARRDDLIRRGYIL